jgi:hypothetical protein
MEKWGHSIEEDTTLTVFLAVITTPNTYYLFTSTYCGAAFRQGPTAAAYGKVTATYTAWTSDNVTISFN